MKKIVVLGSTNTDMVISGNRIPVSGETAVRMRRDVILAGLEAD